MERSLYSLFIKHELGRYTCDFIYSNMDTIMETFHRVYMNCPKFSKKVKLHKIYFIEFDKNTLPVEDIQCLLKSCYFIETETNESIEVLNKINFYNRYNQICHNVCSVVNLVRYLQMESNICLYFKSISSFVTSCGPHKYTTYKRIRDMLTKIYYAKISSPSAKYEFKKLMMIVSSKTYIPKIYLTYYKQFFTDEEYAILLNSSIRCKDYEFLNDTHTQIGKTEFYIDKFIELYAPVVSNEMESCKSTAFEYLTCILTKSTHWNDYDHIKLSYAGMPDLGIDCVNDSTKTVYQCKLHPTNSYMFQYGALSTFCALSWRYFRDYKKIIITTGPYELDNTLKQVYDISLIYIPDEKLNEMFKYIAENKKNIDLNYLCTYIIAM